MYSFHLDAVLHPEHAQGHSGEEQQEETFSKTKLMTGCHPPQPVGSLTGQEGDPSKHRKAIPKIFTYEALKRNAALIVKTMACT